MASPAGSTARAQPRRLRVLACEACRSRRTRCDGQKPTCGTCESRGCPCHYPEENKRTAPSVENQLVQIRSQLDRIEHFVASGGSECHSNRSVSHATVSGPVASSPWACTGSASSVSASPGVIAARDFPYMKLQTSTFTQMAGLGEDYGNMVIRLEQAAPLATSATTPILTLKHDKVVSALQSFSARIHPWYPILEDNFSTSVAALVARPFERNTDAFLVLMVLASGSFAQAASPTRSHSGALKDRPDAMYLDAAMSMLHVVVLEQSLRSVQCLVAASIHFYLLLKPLQAHDLVLLAIKKAQNLYMSGAFQDDHAAFEHWIRVYRIALLIEGELVVPLQLADSNAWETEDEISLPTGTSIWSFEANHSMSPPAGTAVSSPPHTNGTSASITSSPAVTPAAETEPPAQSIRPDEAITYLLAEIAMRRMLRRNTTAITISADGIAEYAPLVAKELETQLEQWCSVLPGPLRFARDFEPLPPETPLQTPFLRTQYWACMVSFYWPAVVQVMELQRLVGVSVDGCRSYFHSYREFTKSAAEALKTCLPNKWTIYASIFAISLGAYMGASDPLLAPIASWETWDVLNLARDAFGEECRYSPSLSVMAESMRVTLSGVQDTPMG